MADCAICGAKTSLYVEGRPLCTKCAASSPQERQKMREQRVPDIQEPSAGQLTSRSGDEILRPGCYRPNRRIGDIGADFDQVRKLYRLARLNSAT